MQSFHNIMEHHEKFHEAQLLSLGKYEQVLKACMDLNACIIDIHENWRAELISLSNIRENFTSEDNFISAVVQAYYKNFVDVLV